MPTQAAMQGLFACGSTPTDGDFATLIAGMFQNVLCGNGAPAAPPEEPGQPAVYFDAANSAIYYYCNGAWFDVGAGVVMTASNGLNDQDPAANSFDVELGGTLDKVTTVNQNGLSMFWNQTATESFVVGGTTAVANTNLVVEGESSFGDVNHTITDGTNALASGTNHTVSGTNAVAFGNQNTVTSETGFAHGIQSTVTGLQSAVIGGGLHDVAGVNAFVGGGADNNITNAASLNSAILGGRGNNITGTGDTSAIIAGNENTVNTTGDQATIVGGTRNTINATGFGNTIVGSKDSTVTGASDTAGIFASDSSTLGGTSSTSQIASTVNGTTQNGVFASAIHASRNAILDTVNQSVLMATRGGSLFNTNNAGVFASLDSSIQNSLQSFVAGSNNMDIATDTAGEQANAGIAAQNSTITGTSSVATVMASSGANIDDAYLGVIIGSDGAPQVTSQRGMILQGSQIGGLESLSTAFRGLAIGGGAQANHDTALVINRSFGVGLQSAVAQEMAVRAPGGYRFFTDNAGTGAQLAANATGWTVLSSGEAKEIVGTPAPTDILTAMKQVSAVVYTMKEEGEKGKRAPAVRNVGIVAEEFNDAFSSFLDPKTFDGRPAINQSDQMGVMWAVLRALIDHVGA